MLRGHSVIIRACGLVVTVTHVKEFLMPMAISASHKGVGGTGPCLHHSIIISPPFIYYGGLCIFHQFSAEYTCRYPAGFATLSIEILGSGDYSPATQLISQRVCFCSHLIGIEKQKMGKKKNEYRVRGPSLRAGHRYPLGLRHMWWSGLCPHGRHSLAS